jgi:hypothetical protein
LASLASLEELHVVDISSSVAQGLTQLTSLCLHSCTDTLSDLLMHCLVGMQQLQQLELKGKDYMVPAALVPQLFSATPNLKSLTLCNIIQQQSFDALLAHATRDSTQNSWQRSTVCMYATLRSNSSVEGVPACRSRQWRSSVSAHV